MVGPDLQFTPTEKNNKTPPWRPTLSGPRSTRIHPTLRACVCVREVERTPGERRAHSCRHLPHPPPPSLQPVAETRAKQSALWRDLMLAYCRAKRMWSVTADGGDKDELFCNKAIDRELVRWLVGAVRGSSHAE